MYYGSGSAALAPQHWYRIVPQKKLTILVLCYYLTWAVLLESRAVAESGAAGSIFGSGNSESWAPGVWLIQLLINVLFIRNEMILVWPHSVWSKCAHIDLLNCLIFCPRRPGTSSWFGTVSMLGQSSSWSASWWALLVCSVHLLTLITNRYEFKHSTLLVLFRCIRYLYR